MTEKVCFDKILPKDLMRPHRRTRGLDGNDRAISPIGKSWMNGTTLRCGSSAARRRSRPSPASRPAGGRTRATSPSTSATTRCRRGPPISFDQNDGAWSYVGTDNKSIPANEATMNLGFLDGGTAGHEFGHAIALAHEHSNPAGRDQWNEPVVIAALASRRTSGTRRRCGTACSASMRSTRSGHAVRPDSIMLYAFPASWTLNAISTRERGAVRARQGSSRGPRCIRRPGPSSPSGAAAARRDEGQRRHRQGRRGGHRSRSSPTASTRAERRAGRRTSTSSSSDRTATPIAEDDDSGYGLNARIRRGLVPGAVLGAGAPLERRDRHGEVLHQRAVPLTPPMVASCRVWATSSSMSPISTRRWRSTAT